MDMKYKVVLRRSDEGVSASVPGLPGCWSQGADAWFPATARSQAKVLEELRTGTAEPCEPP